MTVGFSDTDPAPGANAEHHSAIQHHLHNSHLPALDGLRAIAVGLVIFFHLGFEFVPGAYGVMMFFVISGFLITWLLLKESAKTGTVSLREFYKRRTLRIFPAFYVFLAAWIALLYWSHHDIPWAHATSAFFYVSNYYNAILGDPNDGFSHTWSLAIEEQFYLLWPAAFLLLRRRPAAMASTLAATIIGIWIYRWILCLGFNVNQGYIYAAFDTRFDSLLTGCLLAVLLKQRLLQVCFERLTNRAFLPLLSAAALILAMYFPELTNIDVYRYRDLYGFLITPGLIAILIAQLIANNGHWLWRWLGWRPVRYLGTISYSMYLYQQVVLEPVEKAMHAWPHGVAIIAAAAATVAVASLSYYVVERPFLRLRYRRSDAAN